VSATKCVPTFQQNPLPRQRKNGTLLATFTPMKIKALILSAFLTAFFGRGEVLVYALKSKATTTGNTNTLSTSYTGWLVMDSSTGNFTELYVYAKGKTFFTYTPQALTLADLTNGKGQNVDVIVDSFSNGRYVYKGTDAQIFTGLRTVSFAASFQFSGSTLSNESANQLYEEIGTLIFDKKTTGAQNLIDGNFTNTVARLTTQLKNQGYTDLD
jgi:hypothetical protein